jgi:hypothetical protein
MAQFQMLRVAARSTSYHIQQQLHSCECHYTKRVSHTHGDAPFKMKLHTRMHTYGYYLYLLNNSRMRISEIDIMWSYFIHILNTHFHLLLKCDISFVFSENYIVRLTGRETKNDFFLSQNLTPAQGCNRAA